MYYMCLCIVGQRPNYANKLLYCIGRKKILSQAISPFLTMFSTAIYEGHFLSS